jgi:hypothetical protein
MTIVVKLKKGSRKTKGANKIRGVHGREASSCGVAKPDGCDSQTESTSSEETTNFFIV